MNPSGDGDPQGRSGRSDGARPAPNVTVRPAERADLLDVLRIERESFTEPWPYSAFESLLDAPAFLIAVGDPGGVWDDQSILGYVVGDVTPNHGRDIGHIKDLAVHPEARDEGLGRALLRAVLARLRGSGAAVVRLEVRESNAVARSLYADEGFAPVRRVSNYYRDGEDALVLVADLGEWATGQ